MRLEAGGSGMHVVASPSASIEHEAEREFHDVCHRVYRAAKSYVDASLRDASHDPATTRICEPDAYAAAVHRVFRVQMRDAA